MKPPFRKSIAALTAACLLVFTVITAVPFQAGAAAEGVSSGLPARGSQEIAAMWKKLMHPTADPASPYAAKPSAVKPYSTGSLRADYIQDAVNAINFYRFVSGLPYDLVSTDALNKQAQYGSVLLSADDEFSHTPSRPSDMADDFYQNGYDSTSTANIYASFGYNDHIVAHSIDSYMEDSDVDNLDRVGHRRWILNPPLKQIGVGLAESETGWKYSAMQVFDDSRAAAVDYQYVSYPAAGAFPIEIFGATYAWSVSVNPKQFAMPVAKNVKATLVRQRDNKTWTLDSRNNKISDSGAYFNVETKNFGSGPAIIFRPSGVGDYRAGDRFNVTITGLKSPQGAAKTISYAVDFMSAETGKPDLKASPFSDTSGHWASLAIGWAVDNEIVSGYPDGTFKPSAQVKEQEFLKMFANALKANVPAALPQQLWTAPYYQLASDEGYKLPGLSDPNARANPMTRLSVAELIASGAGQSYVGDAAVHYLIDNRYTSATDVKSYKGSDYLTRAEAVTFLKNLLDAGYSS